MPPKQKSGKNYFTRSYALTLLSVRTCPLASIQVCVQVLNLACTGQYNFSQDITVAEEGGLRNTTCIIHYVSQLMDALLV